jgi:hypothetical protein
MLTTRRIRRGRIIIIIITRFDCVTSLIPETAKGISTKLGIYIKEGW